MGTTIRQLSPEEIGQLTPRTFTLAPIFERLAHYAGLNGAVFLAATDNVPSACAAVSYQKLADGRAGLKIDQFVVSPEFRGHGLGGRLMKIVLDHAKSRAISTVAAEIPGWCPDWRAFYSRFGFVFMDPGSGHSFTDNTPVELQLGD